MKGLHLNVPSLFCWDPKQYQPHTEHFTYISSFILTYELRKPGKEAQGESPTVSPYICVMPL